MRLSIQRKFTRRRRVKNSQSQTAAFLPRGSLIVIHMPFFATFCSILFNFFIFFNKNFVFLTFLLKIVSKSSVFCQKFPYLALKSPFFSNCNFPVKRILPPVPKIPPPISPTIYCGYLSPKHTSFCISAYCALHQFPLYIILCLASICVIHHIVPWNPQKPRAEIFI